MKNAIISVFPLRPDIVRQTSESTVPFKEFGPDPPGVFPRIVVEKRLQPMTLLLWLPGIRLLSLHRTRYVKIIVESEFYGINE
ncbi:hypothetical protein [Melghirimyces algeriensis]|uniref:hypothetical protein n=1 Tax=Melghirimyces algeriensis TaxID=910412 RepID=UPI001157F090|nr:hypothetical protein [Melghirimyces algeriensis]